MAYIIIALFIVAGMCSLVEHHLKDNQRTTLLVFFLLALVLEAGLREVGLDADSDNYEMVYRNYYSSSATENVEFTFIAISAFFNFFTKDVHLLFLTYALLGVGLKLLTIRKTTDLVFLSVATYICYYFCVHEVTQMRTGVLSGFFLLSLYFWAEGKTKIAFLLVAIGSCFHVSGLILLPILFLKNRDFSRKGKIFWSCMIPAGYMIYLVGVGVLMVLDIPFIGAKLASYQQAESTGQYGAGVNVFGPLYLLNVAIFYYLMYFSGTITQRNKYFPLLMKVFALGMCAFAALSFVTIIALRVSLLMRIVSVLLFPFIAYTIKPKWAGVVVVLLLDFIYMNYGLNYIDFQLLWKLG